MQSFLRSRAKSWKSLPGRHTQQFASGPAVPFRTANWWAKKTIPKNRRRCVLLCWDSGTLGVVFPEGRAQGPFNSWSQTEIAKLTEVSAKLMVAAPPLVDILKFVAQQSPYGLDVDCNGSGYFFSPLPLRRTLLLVRPQHVVCCCCCAVLCNSCHFFRLCLVARCFVYKMLPRLFGCCAVSAIPPVFPLEENQQ